MHYNISAKPEKRIDHKHEDLGCYKIVVSKVLDRIRAHALAYNLHTMPSSLQYDKLFKVFEYKIGKKVAGYIVKRKVLLGDKVSSLSNY